MSETIKIKPKSISYPPIDDELFTSGIWSDKPVDKPSSTALDGDHDSVKIISVEPSSKTADSNFSSYQPESSHWYTELV